LFDATNGAVVAEKRAELGCHLQDKNEREGNDGIKFLSMSFGTVMGPAKEKVGGRPPYHKNHCRRSTWLAGRSEEAHPWSSRRFLRQILVGKVQLGHGSCRRHYRSARKTAPVKRQTPNFDHWEQSYSGANLRCCCAESKRSYQCCLEIHHGQEAVFLFNQGSDGPFLCEEKMWGEVDVSCDVEPWCTDEGQTDCPCVTCCFVSLSRSATTTASLKRSRQVRAATWAKPGS